MNFNNITIILCRTSHPGNIGSTARAMQTMGFKKLCLVGPKIFPSAEATALAANAKEVLDNTKTCQNIEAALVNQHFVIGFTARKRELTQPHVNLKDLPGEIVKLKEKQNIAILFGNETNGLSNEEIKFCNMLCYIDSESNAASLNLAQAVQICCYELKMTLKQKQNSLIANVNAKSFVTNDRLNGFYEHLESTLDELGFLKKIQAERLMQRLRLLFNRTQLDEDELNILRGILSEIQKKIK